MRQLDDLASEPRPALPAAPRERPSLAGLFSPAAEQPREAPCTVRDCPRADRLRRRRLWTWAQFSALTALAWLCLFNLSVVRGSSMAPGIHDGDRILIDPWSYVFGGVRRGDVVVLKYPLDPSVDYIKRVIGLPGDEIVLEGGRVWVNSEELAEPYVDEPDPYARHSTRVKPAHFFVLGDNRTRSCDSREFGQVPKDYVRGRVELRVWPPQRFGRIAP